VANGDFALTDGFRQSKAGFAAAIIQTLDSLHLKYPEVGRTRRRQSRIGEIAQEPSNPAISPLLTFDHWQLKRSP
jgi:hypothetical protein